MSADAGDGLVEPNTAVSWHARTVFFARNADQALSFYTKKLGFKLDWNFEHAGTAFVFQVSLYGLEIIVNQAEDPTADSAGKGRVFIGLDDNQVAGFHRHIQTHSIETAVVQWGEPTIVISDPDGNELFFWLSEGEREKLREEIGQDGQSR